MLLLVAKLRLERNSFAIDPDLDPVPTVADMLSYNVTGLFASYEGNCYRNNSNIVYLL